MRGGLLGLVAAVYAIGPPELVPTTRHDRRDEPGVRAPAKALVIGKPKDAACGKISIAPTDAAEHDLLAGRLKISLAKYAREVGEGGATAAEETRVVIDGGAIAMAVMA